VIGANNQAVPGNRDGLVTQPINRLIWG